MVSIGYLHVRHDPNHVKKLYAFASVAKLEGADFFYFTAGRVNLAEHKITGMVYEKGSWVAQTYAYPDVIYNDSSPSSETARDIIDQLRAEIPFTSQAVGDKLTVYEKLQAGKKYHRFLIPSLEVTSSKQVFDFLRRHPRSVLKPIRGHRGIGVIFLQRSGREVAVREGSFQQTMTQETLRQFLDKRLHRNIHLVQPFIRSVTKSGLAYDFRLHVQKNGSGKWVLTSMYPRIAAPGTMTPNLSSGGYSQFTKAFFEQEFGEEQERMQATLHDFAVGLAAHMDDVYADSFDELGIDVGVDRQRNIWLYEVNWKPGVPLDVYMELDVVKHSIQYCMYLAQKRSC